jgi:hypothetical protein
MRNKERARNEKGERARGEREVSGGREGGAGSGGGGGKNEKRNKYNDDDAIVIRLQLLSSFRFNVRHDDVPFESLRALLEMHNSNCHLLGARTLRFYFVIARHARILFRNNVRTSSLLFLRPPPHLSLSYPLYIGIKFNNKKLTIKRRNNTLYFASLSLHSAFSLFLCFQLLCGANEYKAYSMISVDTHFISFLLLLFSCSAERSVEYERFF